MRPILSPFLVLALLLTATATIAESVTAQNGLSLQLPNGWHGRSGEDEVVVATSQAALRGWPDQIDSGQLVISVSAMPAQFLTMMMPEVDIEDPAAIAGGFAMFLATEGDIAVTSEPGLFAGLEGVGSVSVTDSDGHEGAILVAVRNQALLVASAVGALEKFRGQLVQILDDAREPTF